MAVTTPSEIICHRPAKKFWRFPGLVSSFATGVGASALRGFSLCIVPIPSCWVFQQISFGCCSRGSPNGFPARRPSTSRTVSARRGQRSIRAAVFPREFVRPWRANSLGGLSHAGRCPGRRNKGGPSSFEDARPKTVARVAGGKCAERNKLDIRFFIRDF